MQRVQFRTREGVAVSQSNLDPCYARKYALKKAARLGHTTLLEEDSKTGRLLDITRLLGLKANS